MFSHSPVNASGLKPSRLDALVTILEEEKRPLTLRITQPVEEEIKKLSKVELEMEKHQLLIPMNYEHYLELRKHEKEQIIYSHFHHIKQNYEIEALIDRLHRIGAKRFKIYEWLLFKKIDNPERLLKYFEKRKGRRTSRIELVKKALAMLETKGEITIEELSFLPNKIFVMLALYTKYAGNNREAMRKFLKRKLKMLEREKKEKEEEKKNFL
ncbi:MAG: hypothetical protein QXY05_02940 [Candidatus Anstonellales archaeon]